MTVGSARLCPLWLQCWYLTRAALCSVTRPLSLYRPINTLHNQNANCYPKNPRKEVVGRTHHKL